MIRRPPSSTLFPYTTLFRSHRHLTEPARLAEIRGTVGPVELQVNGAILVREAEEREGEPHFVGVAGFAVAVEDEAGHGVGISARSEEDTSELQSRPYLGCRL